MLNSAFRPVVAPLFVPGDRPERFAKAAASGADAVILDLEDAVAPQAREAARQAVANHGIDSVAVIVRVNATSSDAFQADIAALRYTRFDALMLAKAETASDIDLVHGAFGREIPVIALVESARAFKELDCLLGHPGVVQSAFGSLDLALDLGCQPSWDALAYCRGALILQSCLAGLPAPLDGVTTRLDDAALIQADAATAYGLGFGGKLAIHPNQVALILDAFMPDASAIAWAHEVLKAAGSGAAIKVNGAMVDRPLIERARRILSRSSFTGETNA